jgi:hypothetical protein
MLPFLLAVALLPSMAEPPPPVALVLTVQGKVALQPGGDQDKARRLGAMDLLRPGDRCLAEGTGEAVVVFLDDGHRERLKPGRRAEVGDKGCTPADAVEWQEAVKLSAAYL